jgi:hypothetical protein
MTGINTAIAALLESLSDMASTEFDIMRERTENAKNDPQERCAACNGKIVVGKCRVCNGAKWVRRSVNEMVVGRRNRIKA